MGAHTLGLYPYNHKIEISGNDRKSFKNLIVEIPLVTVRLGVTEGVRGVL